MDLGLKNKRVLVTGASNGIGAETAHLLAAEGAIVGVHGRDEKRIQTVVDAIRTSGGEAHALPADIYDAAAVEALADAAIAALGQIDILVCNAGGASRTDAQGWEDYTVEDYARTYQLNVTSSMQLIKRLAPGMRERGHGRIILISSAAALEPQAGQPDYGAAKAAMISLVVSTSKWLRNSGVTINGISPGAVLTPGLEGFLQSTAKRRGWSGDLEAIEKTAAQSMFRIPVGRVGRASEIAGMVAYLSSDWAGYIHGANIHINGGVIGTFT